MTNYTGQLFLWLTPLSSFLFLDKAMTALSPTNLFGLHLEEGTGPSWRLWTRSDIGPHSILPDGKKCSTSAEAGLFPDQQLDEMCDIEKG